MNLLFENFIHYLENLKIKYRTIEETEGVTVDIENELCKNAEMAFLFSKDKDDYKVNIILTTNMRKLSKKEIEAMMAEVRSLNRITPYRQYNIRDIENLELKSILYIKEPSDVKVIYRTINSMLLDFYARFKDVV